MVGIDSLFEIQGAVAVVTGATRGIGRQIANALGRAGAHVVIVGRTADAAPNPVLPGTVEEVTAQLVASGVEALAVQADLSDQDATQRIIDETLTWKGRCDIVVNNAAFTSNGGIFDIPWRRWQTAFRVQVVAPLQICQGLVPSMLQRGSGRVLNISSGSSQALMPQFGLYSTSKLAMERWNEYMDLELGGHGVSFNTLRVNRLVVTEGWQHILETQGDQIAMGGADNSATMTSEQAAAHALWMLRQPTSWSGQTVGFDDITALGGPPTPVRV